ncbi:hypothetical protein KAU92_00775 [Candidatus Bathyarchaeota archaeon]|nr:hypothetical protein [Candidatus Bathyarchaeota archaeon]
MKILETIYWLRLALGVTAAFICIGYGLATNTISNVDLPFTLFMNGLSIALVIYLISYYILKSRFSLEVEKPQKLVTTGIGIYFISWIALWTLLYTLIATT